MSSKYETFHAKQYLIYELYNPALEIPPVKLWNGNKKELRNLVEIFRKSSPLAVPPRVTVREEIQEKLKEVNQKRDQMKSESQSKPVINE